MNFRGILLLLMVPASVGGCVTAQGPREVQQHVARNFDVTLRPRASLSMNTLALLMAPFSGELSKSMWHVRWFHAATYRITRRSTTPPPGGLPLQLRGFEMDGWQRHLYAREFPQEVLALTHSNRGRVHDLAVLVQDGDELTIVHLTGRIDRLLQNQEGTDALLSTVDAMRDMFTHLGMAQLMLSDSADAHRDNEGRLRSALQEAGWLPADPVTAVGSDSADRPATETPAATETTDGS